MGILDVPYLDDLQIDVNQIKTRFDEDNCKKCYTSPLKRAAGTADLVFDHSVIIIDRRLIERDLGTWTGMSKKEIQSKYSYAFTETGTMNFFYTPPGGEAYRDMIRRVADFLTDTYEREKDPIAIITHNGVFRVIKSLITGSPMGYVFTNSEPHLIPQTFTVDENIIKKVRNNCFYTVDLK